jgi:hypothetical protein
MGPLKGLKLRRNKEEGSAFYEGEVIKEKIR